MIDLIQEAINRGYTKGTKISYVSGIIDFVEGDWFEIENGNVNAYLKPPSERKTFEDNNHDTLYNAEKNKWVKIIK